MIPETISLRLKVLATASLKKEVEDDLNEEDKEVEISELYDDTDSSTTAINRTSN